MKTKLILLIQFLTLSFFVQADVNKKIENIFDVNPKEFCEPDFQIEKSATGLVKKGCINSQGEKHGLWLETFDDELLDASEFDNGSKVNSLFSVDNGTKSVSLINLIAVPGESDKIKIRLRGFLTADNRIDIKIHNTHVEACYESPLNAVRVFLPPYMPRKEMEKRFKNKYVLVEGVFSNDKKRKGDAAGIIENLTRIKVTGRQLSENSESYCDF